MTKGNAVAIGCILFVAAIVLGTCTANAQQAGAGVPVPPAKVYVFHDLSPADVALIGKGLVKLPYEEVANLLAKMQKQITEQDQPKVEEPKK